MQGRRLVILMWKHLMVRMRRFIHTPIEILSPIAFILILFCFKDKIKPIPKSGGGVDQQVRYTDELQLSDLSGLSRVLYTPETDFTNELMNEVANQLGLTRFNHPPDRASHRKGVYPISNITGLSDLIGDLNNDEAIVDLSARVDKPEKLSYTIHTKMSLFSKSIEPDDGVKKPHRKFGTDYHQVMRLQWAIDTSFIKIFTGNEVTQKLSVQEFPAVSRANSDQMSLICSVIVMLCWISLFLVFVFLMSRLLEERSTGIQEMVKMVGVSSNLFSISHFLNVLPAGLVYCVVGTVLLKVSDNPLIPHSDGLLIFIILLLHFVSIVAIAFPCSFITQGTQYTVSLSVFVYVALWLPANNLTKLLRSRPAVLATGMLPHVPMMWLWTEVAAKEQYGEGLMLSDAFKSHSPTSGPVALGALFLILQSLIMFALAWYLARVRPGQYGQALPWNFLFQKQYWSKSEVKPTTVVMDEGVPMAHAQREPKYYETPPKNMDVGIKIENVTKIYPKQRALSNVTLDVYKGEITVLLGHNGAGKTTLMSIITGMTSATEGRVLVNGADVSRAADEVRTQLGLCPQHNLFFADLTVLEHVMFYTLLKGGSYKEARQKSYELLKTLGLQDKANVHSTALSGGMKRRLQLACALAGGASVLVLDEPTSGLDVETRRELWDLLLGLRGHRTVLLTTHFMEEADALGDRVAALHSGQLRCHATPMYLKKAMGTGYRLSLTTNGPPREAAVTAAVTSHVPAASLKEHTINSLSYSLPSSASRNFPELFTSLEQRKSQLSIETIGVGVSTLEEVFLKLCSDTDTAFSEEEMDKTRSEPTYNKVSGAALYARQFRVLWARQFNYIWHKKYTFLLLQVLTPILVICAFTHATNNDVASKEDNDRMLLDLNLYEPLRSRRVLTNVMGVDLQTLTEAWPKATFEETANVTGAILRASEKDATEYNKYVVGIEVNDTHAKALFTTTVRHAAPVALNLVTNALATRYIGGADGHTFRAHYQPVRPHGLLALDEPLIEPKALENIITYGVLIVFVVLSTAINNASLPCAERASGARHIHMMSGCPALVHWSATCLFHVALSALFLVSAVLASAPAIDRDRTLTSPDVLMSMALVLIVGLLAFSGLMYLVSCYFEERGTGIILVAIIIVFSLVTTSVKAASDFFKEDEGFSLTAAAVSLASYTMPPHAATMALVKCLYSARLNALCDLNVHRCPALLVAEFGFDAQKCCNNEKPMCYMCISEYAPGKELLILTAQFFVYMSLVLLTQQGVFNSVGDKLFNIRYRNQSRKNENVDEIVRAEAVYVEKQIALPKRQIMESGQAMLISDLHKNYYSLFRKPCNAVKGISFSVKTGECFGLLGVNGAGKSTTFKMLTAEECATKGDIYANGHFSYERSPYLRSLGYCPQFFGLDDFLTGRENLTLLLTLRGLDAHDVSKEVNSWIQVVGLEKYSNTKVVDYSGGCKRRIAAAAALSSGAPLTLLDEPTAGVDVSARRRVWSALQRGLRHGRAVIITSHSMDEMEALCSRIGILSGGVVRALGTPAELRAHHAAGHAVLIKVAGERAARHDEVDSSQSELQRLKTTLHNNFNCTLKDEHKTMLHYHINETMRYSELFSSLEALRATYPHLVEDYSVTETTLEEVFLSIAKEQHQLDEQNQQDQQRRTNHVV